MLSTLVTWLNEGLWITGVELRFRVRGPCACKTIGRVIRYLVDAVLDQRGIDLPLKQNPSQRVPASKADAQMTCEMHANINMCEHIHYRCTIHLNLGNWNTNRWQLHTSPTVHNRCVPI